MGFSANDVWPFLLEAKLLIDHTIINSRKKN